MDKISASNLSAASLIIAGAALDMDALGAAARSLRQTPRASDATAGRVIGRDDGNGRKVQPRNQKCVCGSGKKAKHCCIYQPKGMRELCQPNGKSLPAD